METQSPVGKCYVGPTRRPGSGFAAILLNHHGVDPVVVFAILAGELTQLVESHGRVQELEILLRRPPTAVRWDPQASMTNDRR